MQTTVIAEYLPSVRCHHLMEPYGSVVVDHARVELRTTPNWDFSSRAYKGTRDEMWIVGRVVESRYCGALCCGVPVVPSTERYPIGSEYAFRVRWECDLVARCVRDIAC